MFHPASLLLVWCFLLLILQASGLSILLPATALLAGIAGIAARPLFFSMLRRSRWLLITMALLFLTMTPGVFIGSPWSFGVVTSEGLTAAGEHVSRLVAMLALLAILLGGLSQRNIIGGIFHLLRPLEAFGIDRERISARLLLVLDYAVADRRTWRTLLDIPESLSSSAPTIVLPSIDLRTRDIVLPIAAAIATVVFWVSM